MSSFEIANPNSVPREICVFLMNQVGICASATQAVTTQELLDKVYQAWFPAKSGASHKAKKEEILKFFTLWITSPILEFQLKPLHRPFKVLLHWKSLVSKYGHECLHDRTFEPIVSFQRNVFVQKWDEMQVNDFKVLQLLYEEAKFNVLDGRYPVECFEELAAIQLAIELGPYNQKFHNRDYLIQMIQQLVGPPHRHIRPFSGRSVSTQDLDDKIIACFKQFQPPISKFELFRSYLEVCWHLPYYGSAYFLGTIERSAKNCLAYNLMVKVWIAVNHIGIHLIEEKRGKLLMSLKHTRFTWQLCVPDDVEESNASRTKFSSFYLYFFSKENHKTSMVQVTSPQSRLIVTLLDTFKETHSSKSQ